MIPRTRSSESVRAIPPHVLEEAIRLRKEVPSRSVAEIIRILEWDGLVSKGAIKRSTLQENLQEKGFSGKHMAIYSSGGLATRRFQKRNRNKLWHSDIKYGCYLPIGPGKKLQQVYLVDIIYDPSNTEILTVEYQEDHPISAKKLNIGEKVGEKPVLPEYLTALKPTASRLLDAAEKENEKRKEKTSATAISFRHMRKEGGGNV